jgi:hypothetical protein
VVYGQFRTLINLLLVLALGAIFIWGSFRLFGAVAGGAAAAPVIATSTPVVERPTPPSAPTPTKRASGSQGAASGAKASPTPHPTQRPTPSAPPKVYVALSATDPRGATSFAAASLPIRDGYPTVYCIVRNNALPAIGSVTFTWYREQPTNFLFQPVTPRLPGDFTYWYYPSPLFKAPGGKFRCDAMVNGVSIGSAHFAITP